MEAACSDTLVFQNVESGVKAKVLLDGLNLCYVPKAIFTKELAEKLTILDISNNNILELPNAIKSLRNLKYLYAHNNLLTVLNPCVKYLLELNILDLSRNMIKVIPNEIRFLKKLFYLNLSGNKISIVPKHLLSLPKLKHLHLLRNLDLYNIPRSIALEGIDAMRKFLNVKVDQELCLFSGNTLIDSLKTESSVVLNNLVDIFSQQLKLVHDYRTHILMRKGDFAKRVSANKILTKKKKNLIMPCSLNALLLASKPKPMNSTSEYGSLSQTGVDQPPLTYSVRDSLSVFSCDSDYQNNSFTSVESVEDKSFKCGETQCEYLSALQEFVVCNEGAQMTVPTQNLSGHKFWEFSVNIIHEKQLEPKLDSWSILAWNVVHLSPHGAIFFSSQPAVIKLPISAVLDPGCELEFYSSDTDITEPTKWQKFEPTNVYITGSYVQFEVTHFSLFAVVVKKSRPKISRCVRNTTGGLLELKGKTSHISISFPPGSLPESSINASVELLYYDMFYISQDYMQTSNIVLAGPIVALGPNGCQFKHPIKVTIPLPKGRDIYSYLGYVPSLMIICSQTEVGVKPHWEPYISEYSIDLESDPFTVTFQPNHFTLFSVGWKILDVVLPEDLKLHASSHVPHFTFWMTFHAFMSNYDQQNKFGLCVIASRFGNSTTTKMLPQYPIEVGTCKPRKIKTGKIRTELKSGVFTADITVGETELFKVVNFIGHDFDVHFACISNKNMVCTGLFGKVELYEESHSHSLINEDFSFNLIKSVQPSSTYKHLSPSLWESKVTKELAGLLSIDDHMWKELALALGYNRSEIVNKFDAAGKPMEEMLADFMSRGGEADEFLNAMYRVARMFKLVPVEEMRENQQNRRMEAMSNANSKNLGYSRRSDDTSALKRKSELLCMSEPLDESKFDDIAGEIATRWKSIGRKLNVSESELREVELNYQHSGEKEKAFQMLVAWRERDPDKCSASTLYTLLYDSGMKYTASKCFS